MPRHYAGYAQARARFEVAPLPDLLALLDSLYGRDQLEYGASEEEVRAEALRQLEQEWTDPAWVREWGEFVDAAVAATRHLRQQEAGQ